MSINKLRAQVIGSIWQAIAQSGVDLSSIPQDQQEKIVSMIADGVMVTMDGIIGEYMPMTVSEDEVDELDERVLWRGRLFLSLVENYTITSERLKITTGLASRHVENFELIRVQDLEFKQGLGERMLGIGDINIRGQDPSNPDIVLRNVSKPEEVYETHAGAGWRRVNGTGCSFASLCKPYSPWERESPQPRSGQAPFVILQYRKTAINTLETKHFLAPKTS